MTLKAAFAGTLLIAQRIISLVEQKGPQTLDELHEALKDAEWLPLLLALDRLKREGEILVRESNDGAHRIVKRDVVSAAE
jgi:hypothetical protein